MTCNHHTGEGDHTCDYCGAVNVIQTTINPPMPTQKELEIDNTVKRRLTELHAALTLAGGDASVESLRSMSVGALLYLCLRNRVDLHVFFRGEDCSS